MKKIVCLFVLCVVSARLVPADDQHGQHHHDAAEQLGTVSFPISCSAAVQKPFERGVALLHSFWYEEAEKQFQEVAHKDHKCAMAHWGVGMSLWHQLWSRPDDPQLKRGWAEVQKAQSLHAKTDREREYIAALAAFYRGYEKRPYTARADAYSQAMEKVYERYPKDREAGAFDALSLLAAEPTGDTTFANRKKAIAILNRLFEEQPDHPGLAHYIIHSCDKPQLASLGLDAARRYARIAPSSPHALHMPSHIFARLGLWQEDIRSNLASIEATRRATAMHMGGEAHQVHAMDFLMYAYLQVGEETEARKLVDGMKMMPEMAHGDMAWYVEYARAGFPAMYTLELQRWSEAAALEPPSGAEPANELITYWARTIGAAHLRDTDAARKNAKQFDSLLEAAKKSKYGYEVDELGTTRDEVHAWLAFAEKRNDEALRLMRDVADRQDAHGKAEVDIPAREMLGDMLLEMDRRQDALAEFEHSLKTDPNRFNGLYGAAHAAELAQQREKASSYYAQLLKNCENADSQRPELARARTLLAKN